MRKTLALFLLLALCLSLAPLPVRAAEPAEIPIGRQQSIALEYYVTENGDLYHIPWDYYDIFNSEAPPSENV